MRTSTAAMLALFCLGCGDDADGPTSVSLEDYAEELDRTLCETWTDCQRVPDLDSCLEATYSERLVRYQTLVADVEAGIVSYDGVRAAECLKAMGEAECRILSEVSQGDVDAACAGVFTGTVPQGSDCLFDEECAAGGVCELSPFCVDGCCGGQCRPRQTPPTVELGGDCSAGQACVEGAFCDGTSTCVPIVVAGTGETCSLEVRCDRFQDFCDPFTSVCTADRAAGEPCDETLANCVDYAVCVTGVCEAQPGLGAACTEAGPACLGHLTCTGGACVAPDEQPPCLLGGP